VVQATKIGEFAGQASQPLIAAPVRWGAFGLQSIAGQPPCPQQRGRAMIPLRTSTHARTADGLRSLSHVGSLGIGPYY
jgi:hypothetical protein